MNDDLDPLESELTALQPVEISDGLRQNISRRLAEIERAPHAAVPRSHRWWPAAVASLVVAASVALIAFPRFDSQPHPTVINVGPPTPSPAFDNVANTLLSYERALARSPDEFEALLVKNARSAAPSNGDGAALSVLSWSDPKTQAFLGEE